MNGQKNNMELQLEDAKTVSNNGQNQVISAESKKEIEKFTAFMEKARLVKKEHREQTAALMLYMGFVNKIDYCSRILDQINNNGTKEQIDKSTLNETNSLFKDEKLKELQKVIINKNFATDTIKKNVKKIHDIVAINSNDSNTEVKSKEDTTSNITESDAKKDSKGPNTKVLETIISELGAKKTIELSIIFSQLVMFARLGERWEEKKIDNIELLNNLFSTEDVKKVVDEYCKSENIYIEEENKQIRMQNSNGEDNIFVVFGSTYANMEKRLLFFKNANKIVKGFDFDKVKNLIILTGFRSIVGYINDVFNCFKFSGFENNEQFKKYFGCCKNESEIISKFKADFGTIVKNIAGMKEINNEEINEAFVNCFSKDELEKIESVKKEIKNCSNEDEKKQMISAIEKKQKETIENRKLVMLESIKTANKYVHDLRKKYNNIVAEYSDELERIKVKEDNDIEDINNNTVKAIEYFKKISETDLAFILEEKYKLAKDGREFTIINCDKMDGQLKRATTDTTLECIYKHIKLNKDKYGDGDVYFASDGTNIKAQGVAVDYYLHDINHYTVGTAINIENMKSLNSISQQIAACLRIAIRLSGDEDLLNKFNNKKYDYDPTLRKWAEVLKNVKDANADLNNTQKQQEKQFEP